MISKRLRRGLVRCAAAPGIALATWAAPAAAAEFPVTNTSDMGPNSLRQAITDANGNGSVAVDTIPITATGTINLQSALPNITTPTTISGSGPGNLTVRRDAVADFTIFIAETLASQTIRFEGLTVTNGSAGAGGGGGGIHHSGAGKVEIVNVAVRSNAAGGSGGGIFNTGEMSVIRSTVDNNDGGTGGSGGGIHNIGNLTLDSSTVSRNDGLGFHGGGIYTGDEAGDFTAVLNSTIANNSSVGGGGGIYVAHGSAGIGSSTIAYNKSDADNVGGGDGGGINDSSPVPLHFIVTTNSIIALNEIGTSQAMPHTQCVGFVVSPSMAGYNLMSAPDPCLGDSTDIVNPSPLLGPLSPNGGPTETVPLLPGSPAIDAGNPATPNGMGFACPAADQRGQPRGGSAGRCDIGAFEVQPPPPPVAQIPIAPAVTAAPAAAPAAAPKKKCKKGRKPVRRKGKLKCKRKKKRRG